MLITHNNINEYFHTIVPELNEDVFSKAGFAILANWSEQQEWWGEFADSCSLTENWRNTHMGDPNNYALTLYRFLVIP